jgi:hypothetical protein
MKSDADQSVMPSPATRPEDDPYSVGREERLPAQAGGAVVRFWRRIFPWRYDRRTGRRYCKHCGVQQDLFSDAWPHRSRHYWYETMGRGNPACKVNHG